MSNILSQSVAPASTDCRQCKACAKQTRYQLKIIPKPTCSHICSWSLTFDSFLQLSNVFTNTDIAYKTNYYNYHTMCL